MITPTVASQKLLVVDDEPRQLQTLGDIFADEGLDVFICSTPEEVQDQCRDESFAVAVLDLRLGQHDGIELLSTIQHMQPGIRTIIHTGHASFDSAKDAVNLGAFAYVEKGSDPAELVSQVHRAVNEALAEALSRSEQRYRDLMNDVVAIVWECELPSWRFTFVSQHAEMILGYPVSQWLDEPDFWINHLHEDDRERCVRFCVECIERGEDHEFDYRAKCVDNEVVWLHDVVHVVKDETGTPTQLRGVMFDITRRKSTEEALRVSELRYRSLVEGAPVCIHEVDSEGRVAAMNLAGLQMIGAEDDAAVIGRDYLSFVDDADRGRVETLMTVAYRGEASAFEFSSRVDGQSRIFLSNFIPLVDDSGVVTRLMGTTEDVTEQKAADAALRASEEEFRQLAENIGAVVWMRSRDGRQQLYVNPQYEQIWGRSLESLNENPDSFLDAVISEDRPQMLQAFESLCNGGPAEDYDVEYRIQKPNGEIRWIRDRALSIRDARGEIVRQAGLASDVTERKLAELALRESEEKFRVLTEKSQALVIIARSERLVYCNPRVSDLTGHSNEELLGMNLLTLVHPADRELIADRHRQRMKGQEVPHRYEARIVTKSGAERSLDVSAQLIDFEGAPAVLVTCVDISERKFAEEQLHDMQTQLAHVARLSTMGEMVAGIAHEINQPLYSIVNFAKATQNSLSESADADLEQVAQWSDEIARAATRAGQIIKRLRRFVSKREAPIASIKLNDVLTDALEILNYEAQRYAATFHLILPAESPIVQIDPVQLQQVVVNLVINALEAFEEASSARREVEITVVPGDSYVEVFVSDTGPGLPPDHDLKLFDAFVSTKPSGMGMGLAISKTIIETFGGKFFASTNEGGGAVFHFTLVAGGQLVDTVS